MPPSDDPIHQLLEWEREARRLVDEAKAEAQAILDAAKARRQERLARAREEARDKAERSWAHILAETDPVCRAKFQEARHTAAAIQEAAAPRIDAAASAALRWLVFFEEVDHARSRPIR